MKSHDGYGNSSISLLKKSMLQCLLCYSAIPLFLILRVLQVLLTNCYISTKHAKLSTMAADKASQTTPVQITSGDVPASRGLTCWFYISSAAAGYGNVVMVCTIQAQSYLALLKVPCLEFIVIY